MAIPGLAIPGLNLASDPDYTPSIAIATITERIQALSPETEFRFESSFARPVTITLVKGTAELFGTELSPNTPYKFRGAKGAIFTWHGCELEIKGALDTSHVAEDTTMWQASNMHFALEELRSQAEVQGTLGPRVLLVGPVDSGKSSLAKILTAYAIKSERRPIVVNLDPRQGLLSMPGSLTASAFGSLMDVEEGWGTSPVSGPSPLPVKLPLVYHYGCQAPEDNPRLFNPLVTRLALATTSRLQDDTEARCSGCIIDTSGSLSTGKDEAYGLVQHIVSEFSVNIILVLGSEQVFNELWSRHSSLRTDEPITILKLDGSSGCVSRDVSYMRQFRQSQIKEYFYGTENVNLNPFNQTLDYAQLHIFRIKSDTSVSSIHTGSEDEEDEEYEPPPISTDLYEPTPPSSMLQNSIVAVTHASPGDSQDDIRNASVMVYAYVSDIETEKRKVKLLSPIGARLPQNAMVWGPWPEAIVDISL